jgi:hypothetical protein
VIAKRIVRDSAGRSDFSRLAKYVLTAQGRSDPATWVRTADYVLDTAHQGAKVGTVRITNCRSEDPAMAVAEIKATQARNTRSKTDKTYHLVVSFPPGERPDAAQLRYIEDELCAAIGFQDHQRLSAVHTDTDHLHLHVAINKVHPRSFSNIEPYFDYKRLMETCARLEIELNLERTHHRGSREHTLETTQESLHAIAHQDDREHVNSRAAAALRKSYLEEIAREPEAHTLNGVRTLSGVGVVQLDGGGQVLLPGDASDYLEPAGAERHDAMRWGSDGTGGEGPRSADRVTETPRGKANQMEAFASRQSLLGFIRHRVREAAHTATSWAELHGVLATYGLIAKRRGAGLVIGTTDGLFVKASDVARSLSLGFLTQRLGGYEEAAVEAHGPQPGERYQGDPRQTGMRTGHLFAAYRQERETALKARATARERLREAHRRYAVELVHWYARERGRLRADNRLRGRLKFEALRDLGHRKRTDFRTRRDLEKAQWSEVIAAAPLPTWQAFLEARVAVGDLEALNVLRSRASLPRRRQNSVRPEQAETSRAAVITELQPRARQNGDLIYQLRDGGSVVDSAVSLRVDALSDGALALALSLAATRFAGQRLLVDGTTEFGLKLARVARAQGLKIQFADAALEEERLRHGERPAATQTELSSAMDAYIAERNNLRSRVSDLDFHRRWSTTDAGTYLYSGRRHLGDGSHVLLLQGTETMLVMPVTGAQAAKAGAWKIATPVDVDENGGLVVKLTRVRQR